MELTIEKRDSKANSNLLRKEGKLPAVIYGRSEESTPISVNRKVFEKLYREAGESTVITLNGLGAAKDALIHEVVFHPVSGEPVHADFYAIQKGQTVTVSVPLEFEGVSPAVKDFGGTLVKVMHEIEIECEPKDLPQEILVDISVLKNLEDKIEVKDLKLPPSARIFIDLEEVVVLVTTAEEEPAEPTAMDISQIGDAVERGKKEEVTPEE
jgi:large subunit ribosomal protein L25